MTLTDHIALLVCCSLSALFVRLVQLRQRHPRKFDEFGDINCEDEMARLDNFAIQLQNEPCTKGVIIFYGGRTFQRTIAETRRSGGARSSR